MVDIKLGDKILSNTKLYGRDVYYTVEREPFTGRIVRIVDKDKNFRTLSVKNLDVPYDEYVKADNSFSGSHSEKSVGDEMEFYVVSRHYKSRDETFYYIAFKGDKL